MFNNAIGKVRTAGLALVAAFGLASGASAATLDFVIDRSSSSVTMTNTASGLVCNLTNCGVSATLASSLQDGDTYTVSTGVTQSFDFLTFTGTGTGTTSYTISAVLNFLSPAGVSGSGNGTGSALLIAGNIVSGVLSWTTVMLNGVLPSGSVASFALEDGVGLFAGNSITTGASITGVSIVPLPAGGLLLITAMGGLAVLRRRKKAATA